MFVDKKSIFHVHNPTPLWLAFGCEEWEVWGAVLPAVHHVCPQGGCRHLASQHTGTGPPRWRLSHLPRHPPPPHALCPEPQTHRSSLHLITGLAQDEPEAPASDSSSQSQQVSLERRTPVNELNCLPEENTVFNSTINHFRVLTQIGFYHHSHVPLSRLGDVNLFIRKRRTKVILTDATQMTDTDG